MPNDQKPQAQNEPAATETPPASPPAEDDSLEGPQNSPAPVPSDSDNAQASSNQPKKRSLKPHIPFYENLYLFVFAFIVLAAGMVVYVSVKSAKPTNSTTKVGSLTDQQLSSIKGSTTLVGDSKQTLDIQSNAIFEGQVLMRADLNVAGAIKVGGALSLPSVTVGGGGTFGQIGVNGGLNVGGDTTLQGQLTVQKNLAVTGSASFGSLNVSSFSVTTLQLRGDITVNQHILSSGGTPGRSNGTALGGGGTASVSGSDTAGTVAINTGSSPPAGCFITVNFSKSFGSVPHVVISPSNSSAASLDYYTNRSASSFSVCTAGVPAASTTYTFDYIVIN